MPPAPAAAAISLPTKGTTMANVEKKFGAPATRRPTVGGGSPRQPPITRWDYPGFTVVFEHDKVVDAVIPGAPPRLSTRQGLTPVDVPMAEPSVSYETTPEAAPELPMADPATEPAMEPEAPAESAPMADAAPVAEEAPVESNETAVEAPAAPAEPTDGTPPADSSESSDEPQPLP